MDSTSLRALTLNLWGDQGPWPERLPVLITGLELLSPDVIALQEVREVPGKTPHQARLLAERLGYQWTFAIATPWGGGDEGLAILSRWPIVHSDHRELPRVTPAERRIVLGAAIDAPHGEIAVFTTHLNYRLGDGTTREEQVLAVDSFAREWAAARPTPAPRLLMGDFNATPDHDEIRYLRGLHTLAGRRTVWQDAWLRTRPHDAAAGHTWSRRNPFTDALHWLERDRRIDYVFVSPTARDGRGEVLSCEVVLDQPGGPPGAGGAHPSDHFGVLAEIRIAPR